MLVHGKMLSPEGCVETESHRYLGDCQNCGAKNKLNIHSYENQQLEPCRSEWCEACGYTFCNDQFVNA